MEQHIATIVARNAFVYIFSSSAIILSAKFQWNFSQFENGFFCELTKYSVTFCDHRNHPAKKKHTKLELQEEPSNDYASSTVRLRIKIYLKEFKVAKSGRECLRKATCAPVDRPQKTQRETVRSRDHRQIRPIVRFRLIDVMRCAFLCCAK